MGKTKVMTLILVFIGLAIISAFFLANVGEMRSDYGENTTYSETGERAMGLINNASLIIIVFGIVIGVAFMIIAIKWALSQAGGSY